MSQPGLTSLKKAGVIIGRRGTNCLRLNFSTYRVEEIDRGMHVLGELFARALAR